MTQLTDAQERARLKGFTYFDDFDQVRAWDPSDVDPLQVSNTPFIDQAVAHECRKEGVSRLMLIHDYAGGYHDYESIQGGAVDSRQYDCEFLQHVETFVYFSHHLVSVPPPSWTNLCHRNGVRVLGTFLVEPGRQHMECILQQDTNGRSWLATKLIAMAKLFAFDGWLINIEASFPIWTFRIDKLCDFLVQLRDGMNEGRQVVWYDGLTPFNLVVHQNTINVLNSKFAVSAGSILTNYAWTPDIATEAARYTQEIGLVVENVYFGIDVWAQNDQPAQHPRITWPRDGGGGTATGTAVAILAKHGLSAGIFGPAWTVEHFPADGCRYVEGVMWRSGDRMRVVCSCANPAQHVRPQYFQHPIVKYSRRRAAGSKKLLYSNFRPAWLAEAEGGIRGANLGAQSLLPFETVVKVWSKRREVGSAHVGHIAAAVNRVSGGCTICLHTEAARLQEMKTALRQVDATVVLFELNIPIIQPYICSVTFQALPALTQHPEVSLHLVLAGILPSAEEAPQQYAEVKLPLQQPLSGTYTVSEHVAPSYMEKAISLRLELTGDVLALAKQDQVAVLIEIMEISVKPAHQSSAKAVISDLVLEQRGSDQLRHHRLVWTFNSLQESDHLDPASHSPITGPFSHFGVHINGAVIGRAHALEYILPPHTVAEWKHSGSAKVSIVGFSFDGSKIAECEARLHWPREDDESEEEWVLVDGGSDSPVRSKP